MPGLDETENEFRWRIKEPDLFDNFRRKEIASGVALLLGRLKSNKNWEVQALRFDKSVFDKEEARKWIREHKGSFSETEEAVTFELNDTYNIENVEIFSAGKWNGDIYSEEDIDNLVKSFNETKHLMKPYLKLGHSDKQNISQNDGLPAIGWINSVRRYGLKLVADFVKVPKKIYDLIKAGAYRRISSEIYFNLEHEGKKYPRVLKAVALLGGDTPAVTNLQDIISLYTQDAEVKIYELPSAESKSYQLDVLDNNKIKTEGGKMEKELEELKAKLLSSEEKVKEYETKVAEYELKVKAAEEQAVKYVEEIKTFKEKAVKTEIDGAIDKLIVDGKILPSEKEQFSTLMFHLRSTEEGLKKFKIGDKDMSPEDIIMGLVVSRKFEINTDDKSKTGDTGNLPDNSAIAEKAKKYAEENKCSYKEALRKVC